MIDEYDQRQLAKMKLQLEAFRKGQMPLPSLIGDLEFLLNAMESIDMEWKEKVHDEVAALEEVYAVSLDRRTGELDESDRSAIHQSVQTISGYIEEME